MQETKTQVFKLGANAYITKPVNKTLLFEKIYSSCLTEIKDENQQKTLRIA